MEKKTIELKSSEIEMIRSGINDSVNLLADDELSELFGELHCGNDYCPPQPVRERQLDAYYRGQNRYRDSA